MKYRLIENLTTVKQSYPVIQKKLKDNKAIIKNYREYQWIEKMDFSKFNDYPIKKFNQSLFMRVIRKIGRIMKRK